MTTTPDPETVRELARKPVDIGTGMPATSHLEAFGQYLRDAFGAMPYHVGSSTHGKTWRDVDVRIMLDDDRFDALFPGYAAYRQRDAWWALVCSAISELGKQRTGLPIDFQVQRTSYANKMFPGPRNPLFVGHAEEGHQPKMAALDARDAKAPTHCTCGCELGKPCSCDDNADHEPAKRDAKDGAK